MSSTSFPGVQVSDFSLSPDLQNLRGFVADYALQQLGDAASYDAEA